MLPTGDDAHRAPDPVAEASPYITSPVVQQGAEHMAVVMKEVSKAVKEESALSGGVAASCKTDNSTAGGNVARVVPPDAAVLAVGASDAACDAHAATRPSAAAA